MSLWIILGAGFVILAIFGQARDYRIERLRLKCLEMAIGSRSFDGGIYTHAEKTDVVLERAYQYEDYARSGKPKEKKKSAAHNDP